MVSNDKNLKVNVWVEFCSLALPCWPFIESIADTLEKVIAKEHDKFFNAHPQRHIYVEVYLYKDLKDSIEIQVGSDMFSQNILYLNLPNTYYRCQSAEHKIRDFPLLV